MKNLLTIMKKIFYHLKNLSFLLIALYFQAALAFSSKEPLIWNLQHPNEFFIGRDVQLTQIGQSLAKDKSETVIIVGSSGIGKTQLAKRYAESNRYDYDIVWWIDSEKNLDSQFKQLATSWNHTNTSKDKQVDLYAPAGEIVKQLNDYLRVTNLNWLLIFDNAHDKNQISDYIPVRYNANSRKHVIITSKNALTWNDAMTINKFTRQESIEAFNKITGERSDSKDAEEIAEILQDYPLAIIQAASYLKSHPGIGILEYKNLFLTKRQKLWDEESKHAGKDEAFANYQFTVSTTLSLTINKLKQESLEGFELLVFCSLLDSKNIPEKFIRKYAKDILNLDELTYQNAIAAIIKYSLINASSVKNSKIKDININENDNLYTIHELTKLTLQDLLEQREKSIFVTKGLSILANSLSIKMDDFIPFLSLNPHYLSHMETLADNALKNSILNNDLLTIKQRLLEYNLPGKRDYNAAQKLINEITELMDKGARPARWLEVRFYVMKSAILAWQYADHTNSLKEVLHALSLFDDSTKNDEERLMTYNRLAQLYNLMGTNDEALKYAKLGETLVNSNKDVGNQDALFQTLARIYTDKGEFETALKYSNISTEKLLDYDHKTLPGDMPIYITNYYILLKMKRNEEAYTGLKKLYQNLNSIFGNKNHPYRSAIEIYYAYAAFLATKQAESYKQSLSNSINTLADLLGADSNKNKSFAIGHRFLGQIYEMEEDYMNAETEYTTALQIHQNNYQSKSVATDDFSDLYTRLAVTNAKLGNQHAAQRYLDLHRADFGHEHPRTVEIIRCMVDRGMEVEY